MDYYKKLNETAMVVKMWTDNCPSQYRCQQNFWGSAKIPYDFEHIETYSHSFAQTGQFKGVWDAAGKVVKTTIRNKEKESVRFPDAMTCYKNLPEHLKDDNISRWKIWKDSGDKNVLTKTTFTVTGRFIGYATDSREEYEALKNDPKGYEHVIYTDRANIEQTEQIKGTTQFKEIKSVADRRCVGITDQREYTKLYYAIKPCRCTTCRDNNDYVDCEFKEFRENSQHYMRLWLPSDAPKKRPKDPEHDKLVDECWQIIGEKPTVNSLKIYCRANKIPSSGNMAVVMRRIISKHNSTTYNPHGANENNTAMQQLLAAALAVDDDDEEEDDLQGVSRTNV